MPSHLSPSRGTGGDYPPRRVQGSALIGSETVPRLLSPDAPILFTFATAKECQVALGPLGAPTAPQPGEAAPWRHAGRDLLVAVTGVGPVAAALSLGRLLGAKTIGGVVNCGIAGSFDLTTAPLGGLVLATTETFPEYGLRGAQKTDARGLAFPQLTLDGRPVFDRLPLAPEAAAATLDLSLPQEAVRGTCITVAGVSAAPDRAAALAQKYEAVAESMEGFAVALAAAACGLPFLELRAVSNRVGSRPPTDWDLPGAFAALARVVAGLLSR